MKTKISPCCRQCNVAKNMLTLAEFAAWVQQLVAHLPNWAN